MAKDYNLFFLNWQYNYNHCDLFILHMYEDQVMWESLNCTVPKIISMLIVELTSVACSERTYVKQICSFPNWAGSWS